jgi:hypothetical protein
MFGPETMKRIEKDPTYPRVQPKEIGESEILRRISALMTVYPVQIMATSIYLDQEWDDTDTPLSDLVRLTYRYRPPNSPDTERWKRIPGLQDSVYTDRKAYPRAFMVGGYEINAEPIGFFQITVIDWIRTGKVNPRQEVVLAQEPEGKPDWPKGWVGEAKITRYDFNDVEIDCTNGRPCFLFLSDAYYPGWKAWVDGKEGPIYQADAAFRAVELKQVGHHIVKMSYRPPIIIYTFLFSLFCWFAVGMGWLFRKRLSHWYSTLRGDG